MIGIWDLMEHLPEELVERITKHGAKAVHSPGTEDTGALKRDLAERFGWSFEE